MEWYMELSLAWRTIIGVGGFAAISTIAYALMGANYMACSECGEREFDLTHGHCRHCGHGEPE